MKRLLYCGKFDQSGAAMIGMVAAFMVVGAIIYAAMQTMESNLQKTLFSSLNDSVNNRELQNLATVIGLEMQDGFNQVIAAQTSVSLPPNSISILQFPYVKMNCVQAPPPASLQPVSGPPSFLYPTAPAHPAYAVYCDERGFNIEGVNIYSPGAYQEENYDLLVEKLDPQSSATIPPPVAVLYFHLNLEYYSLGFTTSGVTTSLPAAYSY